MIIFELDNYQSIKQIHHFPKAKMLKRVLFSVNGGDLRETY